MYNINELADIFGVDTISVHEYFVLHRLELKDYISKVNGFIEINELGYQKIKDDFVKVKENYDKAKKIEAEKRSIKEKREREIRERILSEQGTSGKEQRERSFAQQKEAAERVIREKGLREKLKPEKDKQQSEEEIKENGLQKNNHTEGIAQNDGAKLKNILAQLDKIEKEISLLEAKNINMQEENKALMAKIKQLEVQFIKNNLR